MTGELTVSWSEIDSARQCPHKHDLAYKQRWKSPTTGPALTRGTLWHAVMEEHYGLLKRTQDGGEKVTAAMLHKAARPLLVPDLEAPSEDQELIAWMYAGYVEHYDIDRAWQIVAIEHPLVFTLPKEDGTPSKFRIKMRLDLIVRQDRRLWVVDHKSGKNLPNHKALELEDQFALYMWGLRQAGMKVFGSLHSGARTFRSVKEAKGEEQAPLESRFHRTRLHRTPDELDRVAIEAFMTARDVYRARHPGRQPNSDTCRWRCDYTDACLYGRKYGDDAEREMLQKSGFVQDYTRH